MRVQFKLDQRTAAERLTEPTVWTNYEDWPDAERVPPRGELVRLGDGREMRVIEVCQVGPRDADVYLVPTYVDALGRLG